MWRVLYQRFLCNVNTITISVLHPPLDGGVDNGTREDVISPSSQMSQMQRMGGMEEREHEAEELRQLET